jgi:SH3-like domain-containing protein
VRSRKSEERESRQAGRRIVAAVFLLLSVLAPAAGLAKMVSVAGEEVMFRSGPSDKDEVKWILTRGFPLQVIKTKGKWLKVRDFENDEGWVYAPLTKATPHTIVKAKVVNIRSGPGEKYRAIGQAHYGVVFRTLEKTKSWIKVKHESGKTGWVSRGGLWGW